MRAGWVRQDNVAHLAAFPEVFVISRQRSRLRRTDDFDSRSTAIAGIVSALFAQGVLPAPRDELYPVALDRNDPPLMQIERTACRFRDSASGVHMNGFVRRNDELYMWIARRAQDKGTYPGMLDNMVAGGQPYGMGLKET